MIGNILVELFSGGRRLAITILVLLVAVYISGFIIVNAYLWKFGVVRLEFFEPPFISAGLLFVSVAIIAALFILPVVVLLISPLLELGRTVWSDLEADEDKWARKIIKHIPLAYRYRAQVSLSAVCIVLASIILYQIFPVIGSWASNFTAILLYFSTGSSLPPPAEIISSVQVIIKLQNVAAIFILLLANHRKNLGPVPLSIMAALTGLVFLFVQTYTMLKVADSLYEKLPASLGGGQPEHVIFLIEKDPGNKNEDILKELGIALDTSSNSNGLLKTQELSLIWLLNSESQSNAAEDLSTFVVRACETCPAVEIRKSLVYGTIHLQP